MSVVSNEEALGGHEDELRDALIAYCRLPEDSVERIDETMRTSHLSFIDAAVHIGLVTEGEAAQVYAWVRASIARRDSHIIETALRRQPRGQTLTARHDVPGKPGIRLIAACDPNTPRGEQIRALRTELLLLEDAETQTNCLAILSPCSGEGRSQLSAELAIAFSQLGRHALLIDADLRKPTQHALFGADIKWGLAQALAFEEPPNLIRVEGQPFLAVLPAGPPVPNPLELLSSGRFESMLKRFRYDYDSILIDTPPVSQYADALTMAALSRRVLLMSRAQSTSHKDMKEMLHRLGPTQARILGAVISTF